MQDKITIFTEYRLMNCCSIDSDIKLTYKDQAYEVDYKLIDTITDKTYEKRTFCGTISIPKYSVAVVNLNTEDVYIDIKSVRSELVSINGPIEKVESLDLLFDRCTSLTSVGRDLFTRNTELTSANQTFRDCISLSSVDEVFHCVPVTVLCETFKNTDISEISNKLFGFTDKLQRVFIKTFKKTSANVELRDPILFNDSNMFIDAFDEKNEVPESINTEPLFDFNPRAPFEDFRI